MVSNVKIIWINDINTVIHFGSNIYMQNTYLQYKQILVVCTLLWHQSCPSSYHTLFPTGYQYTPLLFPHTE